MRARLRVGAGGPSLIPAPKRFHLLPKQSRIVNTEARFMFVVAGRRSGKTRGMGVRLLRTARQIAGSTSWYIAPTYRMAKQIMWEWLVEATPSEWRPKFNHSEMTVRFPNKSTIRLHGAENPDRLRGPGIHHVQFDEYAYFAQPKRTWQEIVRPMLATTRGTAVFGTTPAGYNEAYDLYEEGRARSVTHPLEWETLQYTTAEGGLVPLDEIAQARATLDLRMFQQEYEASFVTLVGRVYQAFDAEIHEVDFTDPGAEVYIGMDFNVNPMTWVEAVKLGRFWGILGAYERPFSNTEAVAAEIKAKYPGRRVIINPDPSARALKTSAGGQTDITILEAAGLEVDADTKAPFVTDRINAVNAVLRAADGSVSLVIHPTAAPLLKALKGLTFRGNVPDPRSPYVHITDALGYFVWRTMSPLQTTTPVVEAMPLWLNASPFEV